MTIWKNHYLTVFCFTPEQIETENIGMINFFIDIFLQTFLTFQSINQNETKTTNM